MLILLFGQAYRKYVFTSLAVFLPQIFYDGVLHDLQFYLLGNFCLRCSMMLFLSIIKKTVKGRF